LMISRGETSFTLSIDAFQGWRLQLSNFQVTTR
jgi:hypothetical protein